MLLRLAFGVSRGDGRGECRLVMVLPGC
jgi:hypothetical protein